MEDLHGRDFDGCWNTVLGVLMQLLFLKELMAVVEVGSLLLGIVDYQNRLEDMAFLLLG